jgi:hypothetical protein
MVQSKSHIEARIKISVYNGTKNYNNNYIGNNEIWIGAGFGADNDLCLGYVPSVRTSLAVRWPLYNVFTSCKRNMIKGKGRRGLSVENVLHLNDKGKQDLTYFARPILT